MCTALGWIPALAASVIEGGCWTRSEEGKAGEGKKAEEQEAVCGREDVLDPDAEFYLFLPRLGIAQCRILLLDFF